MSIRQQIEARLELHKRINQTIQNLEGWGMPPDRDPLPFGTPADTRALFDEARQILTRLLALADRDVDTAIGS